ncbi:uncharacterized protein [Aegilops tauschii subsp. strangulata]|uniref:uncharacterized protein n=1 Tax=Aegilops tauschii subsp. strangulata TaxID=200361 RepID=UPI003CC8DDE2
MAAAGARMRAPEEDAERRRRRKEKRRALAKKTPSGIACCYGCGHVEPATCDLFAGGQKHRQQEEQRRSIFTSFLADSC